MVSSNWFQVIEIKMETRYITHEGVHIARGKFYKKLGEDKLTEGIAVPSYDLTKRYLLFSFPDYYPGGGLSDVIGACDTIEEIHEYIKYYKNLSSDNVYIWDKESGKIVWKR